jgi:signal transduction histidine kinase
VSEQASPKAPWRTLPLSLYVRLTLLLLAGLLVAQGVSLWLQWDERTVVVTQARRLNFADQIARTIRILEAARPDQRPTTLPALQDNELSAVLIGPSQVSPISPRGAIGRLVAQRLGSERQIRHVGPGAGPPSNALTERTFDVRLEDGQWVRITIGRATESDAPALPRRLILQLLLTLIIVTAVVMMAVRQATRPLQQLALAADTLGHDLDAPPLTEQGSSETRSAAQAFNRMQTRIQRLVRERARALAAVSHDLRTPLTRLRLRAELIEDTPLRDQMSSDLDAMAAMLDGTLDYLRALQTNEVRRAIDINALLESMTDDALVLGRSIQINGRTLAPFNGRLSALRRALQNLIDNAFKYGHGASIVVEDDAAALRITVRDNGPGIPAHELAHVTEPYHRGDNARSQPGGGVGLGLSIVRDIALMHDGELLLANRATGGLDATLLLPRR